MRASRSASSAPASWVSPSHGGSRSSGRRGRSRSWRRRPRSRSTRPATTAASSTRASLRARLAQGSPSTAAASACSSRTARRRACPTTSAESSRGRRRVRAGPCRAHPRAVGHRERRPRPPPAWTGERAPRDRAVRRRRRRVCTRRGRRSPTFVKVARLVRGRRPRGRRRDPLRLRGDRDPPNAGKSQGRALRGSDPRVRPARRLRRPAVRPASRAWAGDDGRPDDRAVPRRVLPLKPRAHAPGQGPDLPGAEPGLPVPRRPLHAAGQRRGRLGPNAVLAFAREGYTRTTFDPPTSRPPSRGRASASSPGGTGGWAPRRWPAR